MAEHVLVAYYSHSGVTRRLAELIHDRVGGDIHEIIPAAPYPRDYNTVVEQAAREIRAGYRPELASGLVDIARYDRIYVGSPNWWSTLAPPVATFLASGDFSGKTILPFCTHGGGGSGRIRSEIAELCPRADVMSILEIQGGGTDRAEKAVLDWIRINGPMSERRDR